MKKRLIYLDNAATSPLEPEVLKAMMPFLKEKFGNPSALYELGRESRQAIDISKIQISSALHCLPDEFIFTASATESDNLAIAGVANANRLAGNKIIISSVEHKGISKVCQALKKEGFKIIKLPVDRYGLISLDDLHKYLDPETILVSVTTADSETGTLQPIKKVSEMIKSFRTKNGTSLPYLHSDATQTAHHEEIEVDKIGVDLLTVSSHKFGGPKGIGGLFIKKGVTINPLTYGGNQQGGIRSGTENVPGIVGFGAAVALNEKLKTTNTNKVKNLRDRLEKGIFRKIPKVVLNGHPSQRLPNILNISILDVEGEAMLLYLDEKGIMASTGSACDSESLEPSNVLVSQGNPYEFIHGSLRFSFNHHNTTEEVDYVLEVLPKIVTKLRRISPLNLSLEDKQKQSNPRQANWRPNLQPPKRRKVSHNSKARKDAFERLERSG